MHTSILFARLAKLLLKPGVLVLGFVLFARPAFGGTKPPLNSGEVTLDEQTIKVVAGNWEYRSDTVSIAGRLYEGWGRPAYDIFTTFDVRGWNQFQAWLGIDDNAEGITRMISIEVDGNQVWRQTVRSREKAVLVNIPLTGQQTLTVRVDNRDGVRIAEPKLIKGKFGVPPKPPAQMTQSSPESAPFAVDPRDLDRLVEGLRKTVDASAILHQRADEGQVAVATFNLIDISAPSVALNATEDLSTSMIKAGFNLVERGQLDKVLKELKIQSTGMIDPTTAQKIGQLSGCDVILLGSISDRGQFVVINARLMDTATGKSLAAERVEMRKMPIQGG